MIVAAKQYSYLFQNIMSDHKTYMTSGMIPTDMSPTVTKNTNMEVTAQDRKHTVLYSLFSNEVKRYQFPFK